MFFSPFFLSFWSTSNIEQTFDIADHHWFKSHFLYIAKKIHQFTWLVTIGLSIYNTLFVSVRFQNWSNGSIKFCIDQHNMFFMFNGIHYYLNTKLYFSGGL